MQELRQQNGKFETWFATFGQQVSDTKTQIGEVQQAVTGQQQELAQVKGEVAKQSDVILQSVQQAVGAMQHGLSEQLAKQHTKQFAELEALLSKRQRAE